MIRINTDEFVPRWQPTGATLTPAPPTPVQDALFDAPKEER